MVRQGGQAAGDAAATSAAPAASDSKPAAGTEPAAADPNAIQDNASEWASYLSVALNALLLPAVAIAGGIVFSIIAAIVFVIAEIILIITFLALVYSEDADQRKIP